MPKKRKARQWDENHIFGPGARLGRRERLCIRCRQGDHSFRHREMGCLETVEAPPRDYVCICERVA